MRTILHVLVNLLQADPPRDATRLLYDNRRERPRSFDDEGAQAVPDLLKRGSIKRVVQPI